MTSDEEGARRPVGFDIGGPLDLLSVDEIDARVLALHAEIERLAAAREAKLAANAAAAAFFKT